MTVKNLMLELTKYPQNMEIYINQLTSEFPTAPVNSIYMKKIKLKEDPDGKTLATETVVILNDE